MTAPTPSVEDGAPVPGVSYRDTVTYGTREIAFHVTRADRKTLGLEVHPSGAVEVRAPLKAPQAEVRARVLRRARWIARQQRHFAEIVRDLPPKEYVNGETHRYLGRQYRLKVIPLEGEGEERVRLSGRYFEIHTRRPDDASRTQALLDGWYREKAAVRLRERFVHGCDAMARYGVEPPPLAIRRMKRRWGSCTAAGRVLLHPDLVRAPTACIDYVVLHELCHLVHPHHGRTFYALLGRVLPDWRERKGRLDCLP